MSMKASVLMSIYNESLEQIKESVLSILSQDYDDFELIIVLDKPERTDVKALLDEFNDTRIVFLINEKNIGLALSMNIAASRATSNFFIRMDADDVCLQGRFRRELDILSTGEYDLVFTNYDIIDEKSELFRESRVEEDITDSQRLARMVSLNPSMIHHPTVAFTRHIFEKAGGYRNFPCSQDADLWLRMAENGCRFYKIGSSYLRYRMNPQSVTNKRWYLQQLTCHYIFELSVQRLTGQQDSYSSEDYQNYLNRFKVNDEDAEQELKEAVSLLSQSAAYYSNGSRFKALLLRARVFFISSIYRRHYCFLVKKKSILR